jgi:hypothetical protein
MTASVVAISAIPAALISVAIAESLGPLTLPFKSLITIAASGDAVIAVSIPAEPLIAVPIPAVIVTIDLGQYSYASALNLLAWSRSFPSLNHGA